MNLLCPASELEDFDWDRWIRVTVVSVRSPETTEGPWSILVSVPKGE